MNASFASCLAFTLRYEGGKADNPRDPGGRTNQGVTQRTFAAWLARRGEASRDVFAMVPAERDALYRSGFWDAIGGDRCPDGVDLALFDFAVNSGPARALKAYAACPDKDGAAAVRRLCARRLSFLHALGTFRTFGRGWTARVVACEALGVKMAEHARIGVAPGAPTAPQVSSVLETAGRAAHDKAARTAKVGAVVAATGVVAHPVVSGATHWPVSLIAVPIVALALLCGFLLWRAREGRLRGAAYAAVAAS